MKHTTPDTLISRELLCFVRDQNPSVDEFVTRYGGAGQQRFHVLRKSGIIEVKGGRITLNGQRVSTDGKTFTWQERVYFFDRDEVWILKDSPAADSPTAPPLSIED